MIAAYGEPDRITVAGSSNYSVRASPTSWAATCSAWSEKRIPFGQMWEHGLRKARIVK